LKRTAW